MSLPLQPDPSSRSPLSSSPPVPPSPQPSDPPQTSPATPPVTHGATNAARADTTPSPNGPAPAAAPASHANAGAAPKRSPLEDLLDAFNSKNLGITSTPEPETPCDCPVCTGKTAAVPLSDPISLGDFLKLLGLPSAPEKTLPPPRHFITLRLLWNHFRFILSLPRPLRALLLQNTTASTSGKIPLSALRALRDSLKAYLDEDKLRQENSNGLYAFLLYSACVTLSDP